MQIIQNLPQIKDEYLLKQEELVQKLYDDFGSDILEKLVKKASVVRENAYAPYSGYKVGSALVTTDGRIFEGINAEAISYTQTTHAEELAIRNAVANGVVEDLGQHFIAALVFVSSSKELGAPCGHCRQIIQEHADNCVIAQGTVDGEVINIATLDLILPFAFSSLN
jgi:cytidine deaminase